MSTTTVNLSMIKPDTTDPALIGDINGNMDTLDTYFGLQAAGSIAFGASASSGSAARLARADHVHDTTGLGYGTPVAVGTANASGSATTIARSDHVHKGSYWFGPWSATFDINVGTNEDIRFYVPSTPTAVYISLHGRAAVAGLLPAHSHTGSSGNESAHTHTGTAASNGGEALTSGNASADHTHTATTSTGSADHTHTATTSAGSAHAHNLYVDASSPGSSIVTTSASGPFDRSGLVINESSHTHTLTSSGQSATHTHTLTTSGHSATHSHSVTTSSHTHTVSVTGGSAHSHTVTVDSAGSGGYTSTSRPAGVGISVDFVDRTVALGGAWGSSSADWDVEALTLTSYVTSSGWHQVTLYGTTGGRLMAHVYMQL